MNEIWETVKLVLAVIGGLTVMTFIVLLTMIAVGTYMNRRTRKAPDTTEELDRTWKEFPHAPRE